jgi:hypothetical protein
VAAFIDCIDLTLLPHLLALAQLDKENQDKYLKME